MVKRSFHLPGSSFFLETPWPGAPPFSSLIAELWEGNSPDSRSVQGNADAEWIVSGMALNRLTTRGATQKAAVDIATLWS